MQSWSLHFLIALAALFVATPEAVAGKLAFEVDSHAVIRQSTAIRESRLGEAVRSDATLASDADLIKRQLDDEIQTYRPAHVDAIRDKMIRRNQPRTDDTTAALADTSLMEMIGELFVVSGGFDTTSRSFSKYKSNSQLVGGIFMSLGSIMILVCVAAATLHFNASLLDNRPSSSPAQSSAPNAPRTLCSVSTVPMEKAVECEKTGGIVAVVGSKESSLFHGTLFKLDEDAYDEPHDPERWRERDVWVGNQGVMYYFSKKEDRPAALYDMKSVGSLVVKKQTPAESAQKFCVSIGLPPSARPDDDPNPTLWAATDQKSLAAFLDACQHFRTIEQDRAEALFSCTMQKLDSTSNDKIEGQFDNDNWKEYVIWINVQGVICYYSIKDKNIAAFCNGVGVGYLEVERLAEGVTCKPFCLSVKNMNDSIISPGGKLKRKNTIQPTTMFAFADERTLLGFIVACEKFQDDMLASSPSLRAHGAHSVRLGNSPPRDVDRSTSNVSELLDRQGISNVLESP